MAATIERLKEELLSLPPIERNEMIHFLIESLGIEDEDADDMEWAAELKRRSQEIKDGIAIGEPAEQVFAEMRRRHS